MRKLKKAPRLDAAVLDLPRPVEERPLHWLTTDNRCGTVRYDITELAEGVDGSDRRKSSFKGRPGLARALVPALQELTRGVSSEVGERVMVSMRHLFRFLDLHDDRSQRPVRSLADITSETGYLYRAYLLETPRRVNPQILAKTHEVLETARRLQGLPEIEWPIIRKAEVPLIHDDVDPLAVARVRAYALRRFRQGALMRLGAIAPVIGDDPLDPACIAGLLHEEIKLSALHAAPLCDERLDFRRRCFAYHRRQKRILQFGAGDEGPLAYASLFAPTSEEVICAYTVIAADTGWIDGAKGIDMTTTWFIERDLANDGPDPHDRGIVIARRPKTDVLLRYVSTRSNLSVYGVLKRLEARSAFLRDLVRQRIDGLRSGALPAHAPENEIIRLEERLKSPFLYYNPVTAPGRRVEMIDSAWKHFDDLKADLLATKHAQRWSASDREAVQRLQFSDLRDGFAARVLEESGGNLFAVKAALGHKRTSSTLHYVAQRRQIAEAFRKFSAFTGVLIEEVEGGYRIDPRVLMARCYRADDIRTLTPEQRRALSGPRTRMGMGCAAPTDPPEDIAPGHRKGDICSVQRCVLCHHGYFFPEEPGAMEALAERLGELFHARTSIALELFSTSSLHVELTSIEAARDAFFPDQVEAFNAISERVLADICEGRRPSLDPHHGQIPGGTA